MNSAKFNPGFRLSIFDIAILVSGFAGALYLRNIGIDLSYILLFVVGHFFYFCNITRMSRIPELVWAVCFVVLCGAGVKYGIVTLNEAFIISLIITLDLTVLEFRKPSYHGIFWSKINPNLKEWFANKST